MTIIAETTNSKNKMISVTKISLLMAGHSNLAYGIHKR
jgi:hypothetical protein